MATDLKNRNDGPDEDLDLLIHRADLDGLVRMIDDRCAADDWGGLLRLRDRSRHAVDTGRQLWPAATLAEYRLALLAPPEFVSAVLDEQDGLSGRFTIGPLTEVAAQHHSWSDLCDLVGNTPRATFVAHERVLRGESVTAPDLPPILDIPLVLQPWEPQYALATYHDSDAEFPMPALSDQWTPIEPTRGEQLDDDVELAIRQLIEPWVSSSDGRAEMACASGDVSAALGSLGVRRARVAALDPATALSWLAWAGASGGAHGRRRGAAAGRFGAWWVLAALGDLLDEWPIPPQRLGALAHELNWYRWDAYEPTIGWTLQLAVEDASEGIAWAITARDSR